MESAAEYAARRETQNELVLSQSDLSMKRFFEHGATETEIVEALAIALVVGGSITIPHLRHAMAFLGTIETPREN